MCSHIWGEPVVASTFLKRELMQTKTHETIRKQDDGCFAVMHHFLNKKGNPATKTIARNFPSSLDAKVYLQRWIKDGRLYETDANDRAEK